MLPERYCRLLYVIIFRHDTAGARAYDILLLWTILASIVVVLLDSVKELHARWVEVLLTAEWFFTGLFTLEYAARLLATTQRLRYVFSFFGIVDLLSIVPTYLAVLVPGAQSLLTIRAVRLLRVFRILKLGEYVGEGLTLSQALWNSRKKITVFVSFVMTIVLVVGALMYVVEGEVGGFTSIPVSIYWAIVTLTTVGYGDIAPKTALGKFIASALMILGYGVIAVPTGIVTAELTRSKPTSPRLACDHCALKAHDPDAVYCKRCGGALS